MASYDIDFVIIWVDGNDPQWRKSKAFYKGEDERFNQNNVRYRDWELLQYWFRGVEKYAPWVRKVHFVTCGQIPGWLNLEHPKLNFVKHSDYMNSEYLPTFSANPIELNLHRIEGLAEHFVFFNDDMFLTAPVAPEDFFVDGLPRCCAVLNPPFANRRGIGTIIMNDLGVIADHFSFSERFQENFTKWINPIYGGILLRTLLLLPWRRFVGFYDMHLPSPFLKATYEEVWQKEGDLLDKVSRNRFRSDSDVNQWLLLYWQIAAGRFVPANPRIGKMYYVDRSKDEIADVIRRQKLKMICMNDVETVEDIAPIRSMLADAFECHLKEKSAYEK